MDTFSCFKTNWIIQQNLETERQRNNFNLYAGTNEFIRLYLQITQTLT